MKLSTYLRKPLVIRQSPTRWGSKLSIRLWKVHFTIGWGMPPWSPRFQAEVKRIRGGLKWRFSAWHRHLEGKVQVSYWLDGFPRRKGTRQKLKCPRCGYSDSRHHFEDRGYYDDPSRT